MSSCHPEGRSSCLPNAEHLFGRECPLASTYLPGKELHTCNRNLMTLSLSYSFLFCFINLQTQVFTCLLLSETAFVLSANL